MVASPDIGGVVELRYVLQGVLGLDIGHLGIRKKEKRSQWSLGS